MMSCISIFYVDLYPPFCHLSNAANLLYVESRPTVFICYLFILIALRCKQFYVLELNAANEEIIRLTDSLEKEKLKREQGG